LLLRSTPSTSDVSEWLEYVVLGNGQGVSSREQEVKKRRETTSTSISRGVTKASTPEILD
jgi:hypothetical protein